MSILSSERFLGSNICIDIVENDDSVCISFFPALPQGHSYQTSITNTNNYVFPNANVNANMGDYIRINGTDSVTISNNISAHTLVGFRYFMRDGYLECVKKEIPQLCIVLSTGSLESIAQHIQESACNTHAVVAAIQDRNLLDHIQDKVIKLAAKHGIFVPLHFYGNSDAAANYETRHASTTAVNLTYVTSGYELAYHAIDWLSYPLIREIDHPYVSKNLSYYHREIICPNFCKMNFKQLVEYHYGNSTGKMLEEIWKVLVVNHRLQEIVFTLGPAVYKTMGYDYLYQFLSTSVIFEANKDRFVSDTSILINQINFLLKFLTPKKVISIMNRLSAVTVHDLVDTVQMITEFDSVEKIPNTLKSQFPNGLIIDFKFQELKELHDKISTQYTIIKAESAKKDIPVHELYMKLHAKELRGLKLIVPTSTAPLSIWGKTLNICIASYGDKAAKGETLLLGVEKEGQVKYCIEFGVSMAEVAATLPDMELKEFVNPMDQSSETYYTPRIVQFRGERNGNPTEEDKDAVHTILSQWAKDNMEEFKKCNEKIFQKYQNIKEFIGLAREDYDRYVLGANLYVNNVAVNVANNIIADIGAV